MAENTIKVADLAKVQDIEFVNKFNGGVAKLLEVLGKTESIKMALGTQIKVYKTAGTLQSGTVAEGEEIPLSKYTNELAATYALDFEKWRKQTTMEAVAKRGYEQAVSDTDEKMVRDIQKGIRKNIFDFLATGTGSATGATFQQALAQAWGQVSVKFEDDDATPIFFVNPLDVADYLGTAQVSMQTVFGFSYIKNFLGLGDVVIISNVPEGKVYATAKENINVYSADCAEIEGFAFYGDETGLIGVHHDTEYKNTTLETVAVSAIKVFPEYLDRIIVSTITAAA